MSQPTPPVKPRFIQNITWMQKTLAGIAGSMFVTVLLTMLPWVVDIFRPNDVYLISDLRKYMALSSFALVSVVGIPQIKYLVGWLVDFYEYYRKFKEFKDIGNKNEDES